MPHLRTPLPCGFGISTRLTGCGGSVPFRSCSPISSSCCFRYSGNSSTVIPSPRTPLIRLDSLECRLAVFPLADFFHEACASSQAFRLVLRHPRFGPLRGGLRGITLLSAGKASTPGSGLFFCRCPLLSRAAYLPFPLFPWRGTVPAFLRCYGVLRPWLTSATWSEPIPSPSVTFP
jgi:hypothetical protein